MLHNHVITSGYNNPNSIVPIDLDDVIGEEAGEPFVKVSLGILVTLYARASNKKLIAREKYRCLKMYSELDFLNFKLTLNRSNSTIVKVNWLCTFPNHVFLSLAKRRLLNHDVLFKFCCRL